MAIYVYNGLFFLSLTLIYFAIKNYHSTNNLLKMGTKTEAVVIEMLAVHGDDGTTYKPVFEYTDETNQIVTFESSVSSSPPSYSVGDREQVIYSKDPLNQKVVSFWGLYRYTIILLCIASPMFIISGGYFLYTKGMVFQNLFIK